MFEIFHSFLISEQDIQNLLCNHLKDQKWDHQVMDTQAFDHHQVVTADGIMGLMTTAVPCNTRSPEFLIL